MWKPLSNYEGYEVSDLGEVRSWNPRNGRGAKGSAKNFHLLTPSKFKDSDYLRVGISNSVTGKYDHRRVHQLVLEAFVGPCPAGHIVMHLDDDPANNNLTNLRYGTPQENSTDMVSKGRNAACKGEKHSGALVSDAVRLDFENLYQLDNTKGYGIRIAEQLNLLPAVVRRLAATYRSQQKL